MDYQVIIGKESISDLQKQLGQETWPEFMQHDSTVNKYWSDLYTYFREYQFALFDNKEIVGVGNAFPLYWQKPFNDLPVTGLDWAFEKAHEDYKTEFKNNLLIGAQILIRSNNQCHGLSYEMLKIMKSIAKSHGIEYIAIPVRPTLKHKFPLIPMEDYMKWDNGEGLPFDPWIRVHVKEKGQIVKICDNSMEIKGSIADWEGWTGLVFPDSGNYIVDNALVPIRINKKDNIGVYNEPNVWIIHRT